MWGFGEIKKVFEKKEQIAKYNKSIQCLQNRDYYGAKQHMEELLKENPKYQSALFNYSQMQCSAVITPYDLDAGAEYLYRAANAGHEESRMLLPFLNAADNGTLGLQTLLQFASYPVRSPEQINARVLLITSRYYAKLCTDVIGGDACDFICYELDRFRKHGTDWADNFLCRLNIDSNLYYRSSSKELDDSVASQMTRCLDRLDSIFKESEYDFEHREFFRACVLSYVMDKTGYPDATVGYAGMDTFFKADCSLEKSLLPRSQGEQHRFGFPRKSIRLGSTEFGELVVLAVIQKGRALYLNVYDDAVIGGAEFRGPVYITDVFFNDGSSYGIFYGIITNDRLSVACAMTSRVAKITGDVVCRLANVVPNLFAGKKVVNAPIRYTYHAYYTGDGLYVHNNTMTEIYSVPINGRVAWKDESSY